MESLTRFSAPVPDAQRRPRPGRRSHSSRRPLLLCASLSPHDEDVPVWQQGLARPGGHLPPSLQDWRAFRAHLVKLEKGWTEEQSKPASGLPSGSSSRPIPRRPVHPYTRAAAARQAALDAACQLDTQGWAHELPGPEVGCVLVARNDTQDMGKLFHQAVVLIVAHDNEQGTVGLVLNKQSAMTVQEVNAITHVEGFKAAFGSQRLMLGGPVHLDHMTILHSFRGLPGSVCVADGLFTGGLTGAIQLVQAGLAAPSDFLLALGLSGWAPEQLRTELQSGYWRCVACSPQLLVPQPDSSRLKVQPVPEGGCSSHSPGADCPAHKGEGSGSQACRQNKAISTRQLFALLQPECQGVPPLQRPPAHPAQSSEKCMWQRITQLL